MQARLVAVLAATVIAPGALAGEVRHASEFSLPAATTMVMPSATARATASLMEALYPPPRLMLATAGWPATWWSIIQLMPATTPLVVPDP